MSHFNCSVMIKYRHYLTLSHKTVIHKKFCFYWKIFLIRVVYVWSIKYSCLVTVFGNFILREVISTKQNIYFLLCLKYFTLIKILFDLNLYSIYTFRNLTLFLLFNLSFKEKNLIVNTYET